MDKKQARINGLKGRLSLSAEQRHQKSIEIQKEAAARIADRHTIGCYVSMREEAETDMLIRHCLEQGKRVCVPKVCGRTLVFYRIMSEDDLHPGVFGVMEPETGEIVEPEDIDIMFVPLSAFDGAGNRTGYGKGYYDSVLSRSRLKVGLAFAEQMCEDIEADPWDIPLDEIIYR